MTICRSRRREGGQTIVLMALLLGILMMIVALVIDIGSLHRVRTETQYVCDAGALAGIAELLATKDPAAARARALDICARNGYVVGQNGVTSIVARAFHESAWPEEDPSKIDVANSNRYQVIIHRELPQYIANIIGIGRTGTEQEAVAAILGAVPIDISFGSTIGFPDKNNLAQFGPDAHYTFGDAYSTKRLDNGDPNPTYSEFGYEYDLYVPPNIGDSGSTFVRLELFDPDTINRGSHVVKQPSRQVDTDGDPYEPEQGGLDEIRRPPPNGNGDTSAAEFPAHSTQTMFTIKDRTNATIAVAEYGPLRNTPFWYHRDEPATAPLTNATHSDPAQAQIMTDLHWITPQGFQFDTAAHPGPYKVFVKTTHGMSENGYSMRLSLQRSVSGTNPVPGADPAAYDPLQDSVVGGEALAIYGHGKVPINFSVTEVTRIPIGSVPKGAERVVITNFDTDVGSQSVIYTMSSLDTTTGQGDYPILFPAPPGTPATSEPYPRGQVGVVVDQNGNSWYTSNKGILSPNGQFRTYGFDVPPTVPVPRTDGNGNMVVDSNGRIEVVDTGREYEGGDLEITYDAGQYDTSVWEVSFSGEGTTGGQHIVLIR